MTTFVSGCLLQSMLLSSVCCCCCCKAQALTGSVEKCLAKLHDGEYSPWALKQQLEATTQATTDSSWKPQHRLSNLNRTMSTKEHKSCTRAQASSACCKSHIECQSQAVKWRQQQNVQNSVQHLFQDHGQNHLGGFWGDQGGRAVPMTLSSAPLSC